jgi:hypothetical protein
MDVSLHLLKNNVAEGDDCLLNIVTGDDSWFKHFLSQNKMREHGMASNCLSKEPEGPNHTTGWTNHANSFLGCQGVHTGQFPAQKQNCQCSSLMLQKL